MKRELSVVATLFVVLSLLLSGCGKKVPPVAGGTGGSDKSATDPSGKKGGGPGGGDGGSGTGLSGGLTDEEIAPIPKASDSEAALPSNASPEEKVSALIDLFFDFDQSAIRATDSPLIEQDAKWLTANPNVKVQIEGHADSRGTNEYNLVLGEKRASAIQKSLTASGVDVSRLSIISYGEERPFCGNPDETCYQENRRGHFRVE